MRELEKRIKEWRRSMTDTARHRPEALEELEMHLRDEFERLVQQGNSLEEAFDAAASKIGAPAVLGAEFAKLDQFRRAKWKPATLVQWACVAIGVVALVAIVSRIGSGRTTLLLASHTLAVTIGYVMMFMIGGLSICYVLAEWFHRAGPCERSALRRTMLKLGTVSAVLTMIGVGLGMIWAKQNWGRYWDWDPKEAGAVVVLFCAASTIAFAWLKHASCEVLVIMGILGNIGTAMGWFGVNDRYNFSPMLVGFIAGHCVLLIAFLVRHALAKIHQASA